MKTHLNYIAKKNNKKNQLNQLLTTTAMKPRVDKQQLGNGTKTDTDRKPLGLQLTAD